MYTSRTLIGKEADVPLRGGRHPVTSNILSQRSPNSDRWAYLSLASTRNQTLLKSGKADNKGAQTWVGVWCWLDTTHLEPVNHDCSWWHSKLRNDVYSFDWQTVVDSNMRTNQNERSDFGPKVGRTSRDSAGITSCRPVQSVSARLSISWMHRESFGNALYTCVYPWPPCCSICKLKTSRHLLYAELSHQHFSQNIKWLKKKIIKQWKRGT